MCWRTTADLTRAIRSEPLPRYRTCAVPARGPTASEPEAHCFGTLRTDHLGLDSRPPEVRARIGMVSGREGGIRTRDLSVPNRARYQASLLPDVLNFLLDLRDTRFLGPEPSARRVKPRYGTPVPNRMLNQQLPGIGWSSCLSGVD